MLISVGVALLSGLAAMFLAGWISNSCVSWYHISSREGMSGYFVIFNALGGGLAGLIMGFITARVVAANFGAGFLKELGAALGVLLVLAAGVALTARLLADVPPKLDGQELTLEVEFRFPNTTSTNQSPLSEGEWTSRLVALSGRTARTWRTGAIQTNEVRLVDGRWILPVETWLFTERGRRSIDLSRTGAKEGFAFLLPIPHRPGAELLEWSDWLPRQQADGQPWPADKMSCRFRLKKVPLPEPPVSRETWEAQEAARKEAEFAAIPADAPVQSWFRYLTHDQPQTERARQLIAARPDLPRELGALALGEDAELAGAALRCIAQLPAPTAEFVASVQVAGRDLAERIRKFNATSVEADPSYQGAADVSLRFSGWMAAVRTLRTKVGGDFTPELQTILELSRARPDSIAMRQDVCRVASFYLHAWAGIAPLPDDPKPR